MNFVMLKRTSIPPFLTNTLEQLGRQQVILDPFEAMKRAGMKM